MTEHTTTDGLPGLALPALPDAAALGLGKAPSRNERMSVAKVECNACPVLCQISEGRTGMRTTPASWCAWTLGFCCAANCRAKRRRWSRSPPLTTRSSAAEGGESPAEGLVADLLTAILGIVNALVKRR